LGNRIVGLLNVVQQLVKIVEEALDALGDRELTQDADRQMRFAHTVRADEQKPLVLRVLPDEGLRHEFRVFQFLVLLVEILERALFVAPRNMGGAHQTVRAVGRVAFTAPYSPHAVRLDGPPAGAFTLWANRLHDGNRKRLPGV
jgi:hypothetical protein